MRFRPLSLALALLLSPGVAAATGMQGHIYMAQCGVELSQNPKVKQLFENHPLRLASGGMFPDSGYATSDYDQGEIPHWEQFVEGFLQQLRERHGGSDAPEAQENLAFLFGLAAHGITDSTFDTLFFPRVEALDDPKDIDLAADVLLDVLLRRNFVPTIDIDLAFASDVFKKIPHDVTPDEIKAAMNKARSGIGATTLIAKSPGFYETKYPWQKRSLLDPRVPGAYAFGSRIVARYYDEILRRIDGSTSADGAVIGTYPAEGYPMASLKMERPDARVFVYFGIGIERESLDGVLQVLGPDGAEIPAKVDTFRGDKWANVLQLTPLQDWAPSTTYTVRLASSFRTLQGTSPSAPLEFSFSTCAPDSSGDCPPLSDPPPASPCPATDKLHAEVDEGEAGAPGVSGSSGQSGTSGQASASAEPGDDGGCSSSGRPGGGWPSLLAVAAAALLRARRRRP